MRKKSFRDNRYVPDETLPDRVKVPPNTILVISDHDENIYLAKELIEPLKGNHKRDWFINHAYFCLPLTIANQYGFIVRSLFDFWVLWDGGEGKESISIRTNDSDKELLDKQIVSSHFGMGTVTIQNRWTFRTPKNINLITIAPPNFWIDGIAHMMGVIETDNLRRDFTFNLKVTRIGEEIHVPKGSPIGCVLPYPRHFVDGFTVKHGEEILEGDVVDEERRTQQYFGVERQKYDVDNAATNGRRYMLGEDIYGIKFEDHQRELDKDEND